MQRKLPVSHDLVKKTTYSKFFCSLKKDYSKILCLLGNPCRIYWVCLTLQILGAELLLLILYSVMCWRSPSFWPQFDDWGGPHACFHPRGNISLVLWVHRVCAFLCVTDASIATRALRSPATWSSMYAHTRGRNLTNASSVAAASSPPGSSSPMRRHTQVIACPGIVWFSMCSWSCAPLPLSTSGTFSSHPKQTPYPSLPQLDATATCFLSVVLWNWNPTTCGLCQWLLSVHVHGSST